MAEVMLNKAMDICNIMGKITPSNIATIGFFAAIALVVFRVIGSIRAELDIYHGVNEKDALKYHRKIFHKKKKRLAYEKQRNDAYNAFKKQQNGGFGVREKANIGSAYYEKEEDEA